MCKMWLQTKEKCKKQYTECNMIMKWICMYVCTPLLRRPILANGLFSLYAHCSYDIGDFWIRAKPLYELYAECRIVFGSGVRIKRYYTYCLHCSFPFRLDQISRSLSPHFIRILSMQFHDFFSSFLRWMFIAWCLCLPQFSYSYG